MEITESEMFSLQTKVGEIHKVIGNFIEKFKEHNPNLNWTKIKEAEASGTIEFTLTIGR